MQKVKITEKNFSSNPNVKKISYNNYGDVLKLSKPRDIQSTKDVSLLNIKVSADKFCNQIKKEVNENENLQKELLVFTYKNENKTGSLKTEDFSIRFILKIVHKIDYDRDHIEVYKINKETIPIGEYIQVKGYGNCKESSISNALKNTLKKLDIMLDYNDILIHHYKVATISSIDNSGVTCKLNVLLGDIN